MQYKPFGNTKAQVPVIGQGTWQYPEHGAGVEAAKKALRLGIELGMTHIDTAELYGNGTSEMIISDVIKDTPRDQLFLVSKVLPSNASRAGTIKACEASLRRLKIDYLDCYLLHWRGNHPLSETMGAMEELVKQGKIRSLGVSNFDVYDLEEAESCLRQEKIVCNQVLYNLYTRGIDRNLVKYCKQRNIAIVGYTPFAKKDLPAENTKEGKALRAVAEKHGATPNQVILAFLTRLDGLFAIPKAAKEEHVRENAGAGDLKLDADDIAEIDKAFPMPSKDVPLAAL